MLIKVICNKRGLLTKRCDVNIISVNGDQVSVVEKQVGVKLSEAMSSNNGLRTVSFVDGIDSSLSFTDSRKSGRTTRIVDMAIQHLFESKSLDVPRFAAACGIADNTADFTVFNKTVKRLKSEHNSQFRRMEVDSKTLTIKML